jgi:hypothetical protein
MFADSYNTSVLDYQDPILPITTSESEKPNIYYIILDAYARNDILEEYYDFNNQELLSYLADKDFFIAENSQSNYALTVPSLTSSLNMQYLDYVGDRLGKSSDNPFPLIQIIKNNRLIEYLADQGYKIVAFETGYNATEIRSADNYLSVDIYTLTPFQIEIINLTPLRIWLDEFLYGNHRRIILYTYNQLPNVVQTSEPTFVFAHIPSPHSPFVFGPNGEEDYPDMEFSLVGPHGLIEFSGQDEYIRRYRNQVIYINKLLKSTIDQILAQDGRNSIIVVQGDHGPASTLDWGSLDNTHIRERMSILNVYYFPDQNYSNLNPDITPVNTFRVILDQYLGTKLGKIEDRSYFSLGSLYNFVEVEVDPNP